MLKEKIEKSPVASKQTTTMAKLKKLPIKFERANYGSSIAKDLCPYSVENTGDRSMLVLWSQNTLLKLEILFKINFFIIDNKKKV